MSKRLLVEMPNGYVWQVPLDMLAAAKASVFLTDEFVDGILGDESVSPIDRMKKLEETTNSMKDKEMEEETSLMDWARENLEWKDIVMFATVFTEPDTFDVYSDGWKKSPMKTIEVDDDLERMAFKGTGL